MVASAPTELMQRSSAHRFRVILKGGWNHSSPGTSADCVLLDHTIHIEEAPADTISPTTVAIITGVAAGSAAFGGVCFVKCGHAKCLQSVIPGMGVSSRTVLFGARELP
jgi:hypothetical protein